MKRVATILLILLGCLNANAQLGYWNNTGFYELIPDDSFIYKYVLAMDNESQIAIEDLLAGKSATEDNSIIKCENGGWYVKNDYPLPEGNYYESVFYKKESDIDYYQIYVISPVIIMRLKNSVPIDGLLEYLGNKVTYDSERSKELYGVTLHYLACNMKTSDDVLKTCREIYNFGFENLKYLSPDKFYLTISRDPYLLRILTGNNELDDPNLIYEINWEGLPIEVVDASNLESTDEGLAITNSQLWEHPYEGTMEAIAYRFPLVQGHDYIVRIFLKVPSDGTYWFEMCSWESGSNYPCEIPVTASDDFQVIDVLCANYFPNGAEGEEYRNCMVMLGCGQVVGTTVVKKVQIYEVNNSKSKETGIEDVKAVNNKKVDGAIYNLAGQKVNTSYKGIVIRNGKRVVVK